MGQLYSRSAPSPDHHADLRFKPFSRRGWALKNLMGNWNLAFYLYTYESPEYGTVQSPWMPILNGDNQTDRAIVNPNGGRRHRPAAYKAYDRNSNPGRVKFKRDCRYVATNPTQGTSRRVRGALRETAERNTMPFAAIE